MDCSNVRLNLDAFLAQALPDDQQQALEMHLNECDGCWQEMIACRNLTLDLNDPLLAEPAPLPANFTALVMARIEAEQPRGLNLVWPWLRQKWSRRQVASAAYAMSATMVVVSAGNVLFLWTESTSRLSTWAGQAQAYWDAFQAYLGVPGDYLSLLWQGALSLLRVG